MKKIKKKNLVEKTVYVLAIVLVGMLVGAYIGYAASPSSTIYISGGVYPGAPSYTVYEVSSTYYAKNQNGYREFSGIDASTVIQNALDNLPSYGGTVFLTQGNYIDVDISITKPYTRLVGEGGSTQLKYTKTGGTCIQIGDDTQPIGIEIADMLIYEYGAAKTATGIYDSNSSHPKFTNLQIIGWDTAIYTEGSTSNFEMTRCFISYCDTGVEVQQVHDSFIQNCMISVCNTACIHVVGAYNLQISDSSLEDSYDLSGDGIGIHLEGGGGLVAARTLIANSFFNSLKYGIVIEDGNPDSRIIANTFFKIDENAIEVGEQAYISNNEFNCYYDDSVGVYITCHYPKVIGNRFYEGGTAINVYHASGTWNYLTINDNSIHYTVLDSMMLDISHSTISNNMIYDSQNDGIVLDGSYNILSGNVVRGCDSGKGLDEVGDDHNVITSSSFTGTNYIITTGSNTKVNLCWNDTSWIS